MKLGLSLHLFFIFLIASTQSLIAQAPNLGAASNFAVFTAAGAFANDGNTVVTGDIGTNVGAFTGFPPGVVFGTIHNADAISALAAVAVDSAYADLFSRTCGQVIGTTLGNNQVLSPNTYCLGAASTLNGDLILDAGCNPNAIFIFKIDGALSTTVSSRVRLINSASICNVFWQINGAVSLGDNSEFRGTILANGAISMAFGADLYGRALSKAGQIDLHTNIVNINESPTASVITSSGPISFCQGGSVTLSGNCGGVWNNGATTASIVVTTGGDYFVTNDNGCGISISNHINVVVNPLPVCTISGATAICGGGSTQLCVPIAASYIWSNGATTNCITVTQPGNYAVTVTSADGCTNTCNQTVTVSPAPTCTISGTFVICQGASTQLCVPVAASYQWSTGATTNCITVSTAGNYSVTVTNAAGCTSVCNQTITVNPLPACTISGANFICQAGEVTTLCAPAGAASYVWSTGATTNCINVNQAGVFSVTVTNAAGCSSTCSQTVTINPMPSCTITGETSICTGASTTLCTTAGAASYIWSTGATSNCITVSADGNYSVTVTNAAGCISTCNVTVTLSPLPVCTISGPSIICPGQTAQLCSPAGSDSYQWSNGGTSNCITVSAAGNYFVTVTNVAGCTNVCNKVVTVSAPLVCTISGPTSICSGGSATLCTVVGAAAYAWSTGATTRCITVNQAGNYSVTVTNANGCTSVCNQVVGTGSVPVCSISGDLSLCQGETTTLCTPAGEASYVWSTGATSNCITTSLAGVYSVTVTSSSGCTSVCSQTVVVTPLPVCAITGNLFICTAGQTTVLCTPPGAQSYAWSNGGTTNCTTVSTPGTFTVTVTNALGCTSVCSATVTAGILPVCDITGNQTICPGESVVFCAAAGASTYLWSNGANTACVTLSVPGTYSVTVTSSAGCTNVCSRTLAFNTVPVTLTCPANLTLNCGASILPANTGTATLSGICAAYSVLTYSDVTTAGTCPLYLTITRTWTATNPLGSVVTCVQTITFSDNTPPVITCPANRTLQCNQSTAPAFNGTATATDNCNQTPLISFQDATINGACPQEFTIQRVWRATDACGNSSTCTQIIIVEDNAAPTIVFNNPGWTNGARIDVQCYGQNPAWNLPVYSVNSITATDLCGGAVNVTYTKTLEDEGNCKTDGYINLFRLTWTATDLCGNTSQAFIFLALIDTIPPILVGIPQDITINCNDIPTAPLTIIATDECLCACVIEMTQSTLAPGCQNGQVLTRTWRAIDRCGNESFSTQNITLIDDQADVIKLSFPKLKNIANGAVLDYTCEQNGIPQFFDQLNEASISVENTCGGNASIRFDSDFEYSNNCQLYGYAEKRTFRWEATDECGNVSDFSIVARLIDNVAPKLTGVPEMACIGDPILNLISATDNCDNPFVYFRDSIIPNPCGGGTAINRVYEAYDVCGNISNQNTLLLPNNQFIPKISFIHPALIGLKPGETTTLECGGENGHSSSFGVDDVLVIDSCQFGVETSFEEKVLESGNCLTTGIFAKLELIWTVVDVCGNSSSINLFVNLMDHTAPEFVSFVPETTIACDDAWPLNNVIDLCGEAVVTSIDSIVPGICDSEYTVLRQISVTDQCGNTNSKYQILHIGDGQGPSIEGVVPTLCDDLSMPPVKAYDACAKEFVPVTMTQDTLTNTCINGLVIKRKWSAINACGHETTVTQIIILNDTVAPVIIVPDFSVIGLLMSYPNFQIFLSDVNLMKLLNQLNAKSVYASDNCDYTYIPVLTVDIVKGNCLEDGYFERRTYTWTLTDICGNTSSLSFTVDIIDDLAPVFKIIPADITIICEPLPEVPQVEILNEPGQLAIIFKEVQVKGAKEGEFIVTRTWTATDICGNTTTHIQTITWIPVSDLACELIIPPFIDCNSHQIQILSGHNGGSGTIVYDWKIVGEKCQIQSGQGTPAVNIYVGWKPISIILTITDENNCVTICQDSIFCINSINLAGKDQSPEADEDLAPFEKNELNSQLLLWPNPADDSFTLRFASSSEATYQVDLINLLGKSVMSKELNALKGNNEFTIDVSNIQNGNYILHLKSKEDIKTAVLSIVKN